MSHMIHVTSVRHTDILYINIIQWYSMYITCFYRVGDTHAVKMGHDGSRWVESIRICASGTSKLARITSAHRSSECRHCTYPPSLLLPGMSGAMRQWVHALLSTTAMLWVQTTLCIAWMESYSFHLNVVNVLYTSGSSPSNCFGLVHSVSGYHSAKGGYTISYKYLSLPSVSSGLFGEKV